MHQYDCYNPIINNTYLYLTKSLFKNITELVSQMSCRGLRLTHVQRRPVQTKICQFIVETRSYIRSCEEHICQMINTRMIKTMKNTPNFAEDHPNLLVPNTLETDCNLSKVSHQGWYISEYPELFYPWNFNKLNNGECREEITIDHQRSSRTI